MSPPRSSQRFPIRTLVLMILALMAFVWMWVMTHRRPRVRMTPLGPAPVESLPEPRR